MKTTSLSRSYSDKYVPGMSEYDLYQNKNVNWIDGPFTKVCYVAITLMAWAFIHVTQFFSAEDCWTVTNIVHGVITFILLHWVKGCPDDSTQGEYNALTLYEQLDAGVPWTTNKKFLMLVPTLIAWIACYLADFKPFYIVINIGILLICLVAKIPQMYRVRIFGINSTVGIDNPVTVRKETRKDM